ncbi:MAG: hypothetical protein WCI61_11490 [Chloroflexota bacterium]
MTRMNEMRLHGRTTVMASLLALALLLGSALLGITALGSSASAGEPGAVYHGFVVPERGSALPKRVRAITESGVVCGSAEVVPTGAGEVGFYALSVFSADMRDGCPTSGAQFRFVLVYGLIDEGILVGTPATFRSGAVDELHLLSTGTEARIALP